MTASPFRSPTNIRYTRSLFYETSYVDHSQVYYTLKDRPSVTTEGKELPSLYQLYMKFGVLDPTEYTFATTALDGWEHWLMIREATWFKKDYYLRWKHELDVKIRSNALIELLQESKMKGKNAWAINRFLVKEGYETPGTNPKRGRPTKDDITKAAKETLEEREKVRDDLNRILQ